MPVAPLRAPVCIEGSILDRELPQSPAVTLGSSQRSRSGQRGLGYGPYGYRPDLVHIERDRQPFGGHSRYRDGPCSIGNTLLTTRSQALSYARRILRILYALVGIHHNSVCTAVSQVADVQAHEVARKA